MSDEVRVTDPVTGGQKGAKEADFSLIPGGPLWELATLYGRGSLKYSRENWRKGVKWSLCFAALMRHAWLFWRGETYDSETRVHHMASVAFHAFALIEFTKTHPELDDRVKEPATEPVPGGIPRHGGFSAEELIRTSNMVSTLINDSLGGQQCRK